MSQTGHLPKTCTTGRLSLAANFTIASSCCFGDRSCKIVSFMPLDFFKDFATGFSLIALQLHSISCMNWHLLSIQYNVQYNILNFFFCFHKFTHITPVLKQLHWLPVVERIKFKILLLTWKIVHGFAPHYFDDLISEYVPSRNLRSSGDRDVDTLFIW